MGNHRLIPFTYNVRGYVKVVETAMKRIFDRIHRNPLDVQVGLFLMKSKIFVGNPARR